MEDLKRNSYVFYRSFKEAIDEADDTAQLSVYRAITKYALDGTEPDLKTMPPIARAIWKQAKPQLDANWVRYRNGCKGADFGVRGGAPKGNKNALKEKTTPKQPQENPKTTPNLNDNLNHNVNHNDIVVSDKQKPHTTNRMARPSVEEISEYMREKGETDSDNEAQAFFDYYDSKGWLIGKTPMKRWRSAVGTWLRNKQKFDGNGKSKQYSTKSSQADNIARAQQFAFSEMESTVI